jgi:hypothetical protein
MDLFISLIMAFTIGLFGSPTEAPEVQPTQASQAPLSQALKERPIKAPAEAEVKAPEVQVSTTPAPTQPPVQQVNPVPQGAPSDPITAPEMPTASPTAPTEATVQAPICEEDMPCWDCSEKDNRTCIDGVPVETAPAEPEVFTATPEDSAWASLEALGPDVEQLEGMALKYYGTVTEDPTDLPETEFSVMDTEQFDTWHIFGYVPETKA